jgi:S1-C subfamily serine protease
MDRCLKTIYFLLQSITAGLAVAFLIVLARPDLIGQGGGAADNYADAVAASSPAVVNVFTEGSAPGRGTLGSAVVIDPSGLLVTNWHLVRDAAAMRIQLADGRVATPTVIGSDPETELALLQVELEDLPSISLGRSDNLRVGEVVLAIGNSFGLSQTVTMGIVSATGRGQLGVTTFEDFIQTDAAINIGNSGGALINTAGELVGINTAVISSGSRAETTPEGIGFAIPVNLVRGVMEQLLEHGRVIRGYLGVLDVLEMSGDEARLHGLPGPALQVLATDGPAAAAGLASGDILTHIDGEQVVSRPQLTTITAGSAPGARVRIRGLRPGTGPIDTFATLTERASAVGS